MKLEKLYIKNFLCYKDAVIEFNSPLVQLVGESGSGKTTILEALLFLFFNRFPRSSKGILKDTMIQAEIKYNNHNYLIQNKVKNTTSKEYLIQKDDKVILKGNQVKEFHQGLVDLFGPMFNYNYGDILDLIFLSSLTVSKTFPIKLIDFIMDDRIIDHYRKLFKTEENTFYDKIRRIEGQQKEIKRSIVKIQNTKESQYSSEEVNNKIEELTTLIEQLNQEKEKYYKQQISLIQEKTEIGQTVKRYKKLLNTNVCPVCYRPFESKDKEQYQQILKENNEKYKDIERKLSDIEQKISSIDEQKSKYEKELTKWKSEFNIIMTNKQNKKEELEELQKRLQQLEERKSKYAVYVDGIQSIQKYFNKVILINIRNYLMNHLLEQMTEIANHLFSTPIELSIEENTLFVKKDGKNLPYNLLSRGEKTRIYLSFVIILHKLLNLPFGLLIDELLDSLDINNYYKTLTLLKSVNIPFVIITTTKLDSFDENLISQIFVENLK